KVGAPRPVRDALAREVDPLFDLLAYRHVQVADEGSAVELHGARVAPVRDRGEELRHVAGEPRRDGVAGADQVLWPQAVQSPDGGAQAVTSVHRVRPEEFGETPPARGSLQTQIDSDEQRL